MRLGLAWMALGALLLTAASEGCSGRDRASRLGYGAPKPAGGGGQGGGGDVFTGTGGGDCVADGVCGNEVHNLSFDVPNVYFVLDRSGSMAWLAEGMGQKSRYAVVRSAAVDMVKSLGPLINVGAALFPEGAIDQNPCTDGDEVFPVSPGDPITAEGQDGPTTSGFKGATNVTPKGGTPVSATLATLFARLAKLAGRTVVLLLTDGGPNCNPGAECGIDECMPAIEGAPECAPGENCCSPDDPYFGPEHCVDRPASVAGIQKIHDELGIDVYVIGITGSEFYEGVLDEMAVAGGTAQVDQKTQYHKVEDLTKLQSVFAAIAAEAIGCEFTLQDPPKETGYTNVYLDCDVLPLDPVHGWTWKENDVVWLHGDACQKLKTGQVTQVKIVTGCPTEKPK